MRGRLSRWARVAADLLLVWLAAGLVAPRLSAAARRRLGRRLARRNLAALELRVRVRGTPSPEPVLLVANHVSWLDVHALGAVVPARFVAKAETARWPIVGTIARRLDAFFIVRGSFRDAARVKARVAAALRAGERVAVFPEGTTTDGSRIGRFHGALLQAALDADVPVQPVAVRYRAADGTPGTAAAFVGDMTFAESLARVVRAPGLVAELWFGPPLAPAGCSRRELAAVARETIADVLGLPAAARAPQPPARRSAAFRLAG
ncbi:MAG TPA: lysophospholipid acyltransferase family protein [Candidatus Binatia bacterium]|nr:lysophospholipid acyltransferase family protein [Candidatus Binatia bacterium]